MTVVPVDAVVALSQCAGGFALEHLGPEGLMWVGVGAVVGGAVGGLAWGPGGAIGGAIIGGIIGGGVSIGVDHLPGVVGDWVAREFWGGLEE
ncbi:MAG: hypothetical protein K6T75_00265 [Acetobacteraceae bacterium]|nr:hypothetical protein [Acetobacteraceae bacterium]